MSDYAKVPSELKGMPQWVGYVLHYNEAKNKIDKIPINPHNKRNAKSNDATTWGWYEAAVSAVGTEATYRAADGKLHKKAIDGIGIMFANDLFGVDLDDVVQDGQLTAEAQDIVNTLDSYTEYSPSGNGVHILCLGKLPEGERHVGSYECYETGRYFTVTGRSLTPSVGINERTKEMAQVHAKYFKVREAKPVQPAQQSRQPLFESDAEIISRAKRGRNGARFSKLWAGDYSDYRNKDTGKEDQTPADLALAGDLAYWTNGDAYRIDALFRQSGLMRQKWDTIHDPARGRTYGQMTIEKTLASFTPYQGKGEKVAGPSAATPTTAVGIHAEHDTHQQDTTASQAEASPRPDAVNEYLETRFADDIKRFMSFKDRKSGFSNLDSIIGCLYPGLYVVGAISSLGKTTFIHQMADQLAAAGDHVLFFSLEQTRLEMTTKSLSRTMAQRDRKTALSAIDIRRGLITEEVIAAAEEYKKIGDRVSVIECNFNTTVDFVLDYTRKYMERNKVRPVVIVDYLQIIPPTDPRMTDKEKIDNIVRTLKKTQSEMDLAMFVVSSLNRANYLTPVDFESFKESGGIEYTADVIWGLQLGIMNDDLFNAEKKIKEKREKVKQAKKAIPRKIELVCLKNRYGVTNYSCNFTYDPVYDLFAPDYEAADDLIFDTGKRR